MTDKSAENLTKFLKTANKSLELKEVLRAGWIRHEIPNSESVADHTYGVSLLAFLFCLAIDGSLNLEKCLVFALIHDLPEVITGDLIPDDSIKPSEKFGLEQNAMKKLSADFGQEKLLDYWLEYQSGSSPEARLVKELDAIEMAIQASRYRSNTDSALDEFFESAKKKMTTPIGKELLNLLNYATSKEYD